MNQRPVIDAQISATMHDNWVIAAPRIQALGPHWLHRFAPEAMLMPFLPGFDSLNGSGKQFIPTVRSALNPC